MRIVSGVQPSGKLHIGNYYGALKQFLHYQNIGEALYFVADWHALTTVRDGATLRQAIHDVVLDYLALGLNPNQAILFCQSDIPQHLELAWILSCLAPMALLERGHSYKDKIAKGLPANLGLFAYPVLMAADILLYGADLVPVGQDQKQHLEMTRDLCTKFNMAYMPGFDPQQAESSGILKMPQALIPQETAVVTGLDGQKMSKSYHNTLELFADDAIIRKKIMGIQTDSTPVESAKPADSPLLSLLKLLAEADEAADIEKSWHKGGIGYGSYKKRLVELFLQRFGPMRQRRIELAQTPNLVEVVLHEGAKRAQKIAWPIWQQVTEAVGFGLGRCLK